MGHSNIMTTGSPPGVRGAGKSAEPFHAFHGITPACAGSSSFSLKNRAEKWDHPRVCGEQPLRPPKIVPFSGSPPRVRGAAQCRTAARQRPGITPACAGSSMLSIVT